MPRVYCPVFFGQNSTAGEVSLQIAQSLGTPIPGGSLRDSIEFHLNGHAADRLGHRQRTSARMPTTSRPATALSWFRSTIPAI